MTTKKNAGSLTGPTSWIQYKSAGSGDTAEQYSLFNNNTKAGHIKYTAVVFSVLNIS